MSSSSSSPTSGGSPSVRGGDIETFKEEARQTYEEQQRLLEEQQRFLRRMLVAHAAEVCKKDRELHNLQQGIRKLAGLIKERNIREPE